MKHIDEIKLELYILNSPALTDECATIEAHLAKCRGCKELYDNIAGFYTEVKNDLASSENLPMPKPAEIPARRLYPLEQTYQNLSPFQRFAVGIPLRMARWMVHHPYTAGGATLMFSSFIVAALLTLFKPAETKPKDMNPTLAEFKGEMMIVENKYGENIDEIKLGLNIATRYKDERRKLCVFFDVDNDGVNEIIWSHAPESKTGTIQRDASIVSCKSIKNNYVLWSDTLEVKLDFPTKNEHYLKNFIVQDIKVGSFDQDKYPKVYILANHNAMFPSAIIKLDARTGTKIGSYTHTGQLRQMKAADLNGDGNMKLILAGINNAYKNVSIIILDPRFISGCCPTTDNYRPADFQQAKEIAYIRIPKTIVGENVSTNTEWNSINNFEFFEDSKTFRIDVEDASISTGSLTVQYLFNFDLSIQNIQTGDSYDMEAKKLFNNGKIKTYPGAKYFEEFKKKIMYWDGDTWQTHPVQNKYYLEAVKKFKQPS